MATTLETAPAALSFAKDPVVFELSAPNALQSSGTSSRIRIRISSFSTDDDQFTITFNGIEQTFTIKASPDTSGLQLRNASGLSTTAEYASRLVTDLKKNFYLFSNFLITYASVSGNDCVSITARNQHPDYDLTLTESLGWMSTQDSQAGESVELSDNHKVLLTLMIEETYKSTNFQELIPLEASVFNTGTLATSFAKFIVGHHMVPYMSLPLPDLDLDEIEENNSNVIRFKVAHAEKFGDPVLADEITEEATTYTVINGGSAHPFRFDYPDIEADWLAANKWLTWEPDGKTLAIDQADYLWFISLADQTAYCFIKIYYTDSTAEDWQEFDNIALLTYDVACVPIGITEVVSAFADSEKTIQKFKVRLTSDSGNTTEIAESRTFYMANPTPLDRRFVHYYNSFGVLQSMMFYAITEKNSRVEASEYIGSNIATDSSTDHRANVLPTAEDRPFTLVTPMLNRTQSDQLRELLFSEKLYIIEDAQRIPVYLVTRSFKTWEKGKAGESFALTFNHSNRNNNYSR